MREIKFRAWDKEEKRMFKAENLSWVVNSNDKRVINGSVSQVNENSEVGERDVFYSKPIWELELMQYTGIKDKNGKEIYFDDYVIDENFSANIFIVKWNKTKISLLNISNGDIINIGDIKNLIIKSNIYENAFELITKYREIS